MVHGVSALAVERYGVSAEDFQFARERCHVIHGLAVAKRVGIGFVEMEKIFPLAADDRQCVDFREVEITCC